MSWQSLLLVKLVFWRRRIGLGIALVHLVCAAALATWLPARWAAYFASTTMPPAGWYLGLPCLMHMLQCVHAFCFVDGEDDDEGLSNRTFLLPLATWQIVLPLMLAGGLAAALFWGVAALFIFRRSGIDLPIASPCLGIWLLINTAQTLTWMRVSKPWIRAIFALPIGLCIGGYVLACRAELSETGIAALIALAIAGNLYGTVLLVARARQGQVIDIGLPYSWPNRRLSRFPLSLGLSPSSKRRALFLFECRNHAWTFPLCMGLLVVFISIVVAVGGADKSDTVFQSLTPLLAAPVFASIMGCTLGRLKYPGSKDSYAQFLFTLPLSDSDIIGSKVWMAVASSTAGFGVALAALAVGFGAASFYLPLRQALAELPFSIAVSITVLIPLLVWGAATRETLCGLWLGLCGRPWMELLFTTLLGLAVAAFGLLALGSAMLPGLQAWLLAHFAYALSAAVACKAAVAGVLLGVALRRRLLSPRHVLLLGLFWMAASLAAMSACLYLMNALPVGMPASDAAASNGLSAAGPWTTILRKAAKPATAMQYAMLFAPLVRVATLPLCLDWNRRR